MAVFLDAAVIMILAVTCSIGYIKGFVKYLICMLGTVLAVVIAFVASSALREPVYNRYLKEDVISSIETALTEIDVDGMLRRKLDALGAGGYLNDDDIRVVVKAGGDIAENVKTKLTEKGADSKTAENIREKLDDFLDTDLVDAIQKQYDTGIAHNFLTSVEITAEQFKRCAELLCTGSDHEAACYMEKNVARPIILKFVEFLLFILCFVAAELLIRLIIWISGIFEKVPPLKAASRFGGFALGAVKGALYVSLIAFMLCTVVNVTHDSLSSFNSEVSDSTYLFKYFFNFFYK